MYAFADRRSGLARRAGRHGSCRAGRADHGRTGIDGGLGHVSGRTRSRLGHIGGCAGGILGDIANCFDRGLGDIAGSPGGSLGRIDRLGRGALVSRSSRTGQTQRTARRRRRGNGLGRALPGRSRLGFCRSLLGRGCRSLLGRSRLGRSFGLAGGGRLLGRGRLGGSGFSLLRSRFFGRGSASGCDRRHAGGLGRGSLLGRSLFLGRSGSSCLGLGSEDRERLEVIGQQIIDRDAVPGPVGLHLFANLGDRGIKHIVGFGPAELFLEVVVADPIEFLRIGERHQRGIAVAQGDSAIAHDRGDYRVIGFGGIFLDVCGPVGCHFPLP